MSDLSSSGYCRRCGKKLEPNTTLCTQCGTYVKSGMNAKTVEHVKGVGKVGLALAVSCGAAVLGGVLWAIIAVYMNLEIGYLAVGIGLLAGGAIVMFTTERGVHLGLAAVGFALLGLVIGKLLIISWLIPDAAKDAAKNEEFVFLAVLQDAAGQMVAAGEIDPAVVDLLNQAIEAGKKDDESAAPELPEKFTAQMDALLKKTDERVAKMSEAEKAKLVEPYLRRYIHHGALWDILVASLTPWDGLWTILACGAAWRIAAKKD